MRYYSDKRVHLSGLTSVCVMEVVGGVRRCGVRKGGGMANITVQRDAGRAGMGRLLLAVRLSYRSDITEKLTW